jgi:hypothetical protein
MSRENVELMRNAVEAFRVGGIEAAPPFYSPDVLMYSAREWPEDRVYRRPPDAPPAAGL